MILGLFELQRQEKWDNPCSIAAGKVSFPIEGFHASAGDLVFGDIKLVGTLVGRNTQLRAM